MSNFHKPSSSFYKEKYMNFNNQSSPKFIRVDNISSQATKDKENCLYRSLAKKNILNFCKEEKNHMQNFDQKTLDLRTKSDIVISISDKEMKQSHVHTNDYSFGSPSDDIYQESINAFMQTTRPELEIEPTFKRKAKLYNETIGCKRELRNKNCSKEIPVNEKSNVNPYIVNKHQKLKESCLNLTIKNSQQVLNQNLKVNKNLEYIK